MASDTVTRRLDAARRFAERLPRRLRPFVLSQLSLVILTVNLAVLLFLVVSVLIITENKRALVNAKIESLTAQADLISNLLIETAVEEEPEPALDAEAARAVLLRLSRLYAPEETRALIFDKGGRLVSDSHLIAGRVAVETLPPAGSRGPIGRAGDFFETAWNRLRRIFLSEEERASLERNVLDEVRLAMREGEVVAGVRRSAEGQRIVSVTLPIQPIQAVVGAVTYESYDLDSLVAAERRAMAPYILIDFIALLFAAVGLTFYIARPVRRLAGTARAVRLAGGRRVPLPDMRNRRDEIGDLGRAFADMTETLYDRLDAIEAFAADVAHEIKNPLTSIRSAAEVLPNATDPERRDKLIAVIQHDVRRLDRLITDISNASRLDAELAREDLAVVDLARLLEEIASAYSDASDDRSVRVSLEIEARDPVVRAREAPLSRVFTNLVDNAVTFSPSGGEVRVRVRRGHSRGRPVLIVTVDDDGPGVPEESLDTIFDRFHTQRPQGSDFGAHSGLGLAIARQIVTAHGGRIYAENRRDEAGAVAGARFVVQLPAHLD